MDDEKLTRIDQLHKRGAPVMDDIVDYLHDLSAKITKLQYDFSMHVAEDDKPPLPQMWVAGSNGIIEEVPYDPKDWKPIERSALRVGAGDGTCAVIELAEDACCDLFRVHHGMIKAWPGAVFHGCTRCMKVELQTEVIDKRDTDLLCPHCSKEFKKDG